ncbi:sigma factor-like helix-turn-helix DNA-binding protein [Actinophytocola sp.]|uniref:sigma factor-like helix-turn-helix DNA-binding protein n=1 Tax=Actinophytocola sp. TaxID=1872138 RepID=UPI0025B975AD|nr:sigma factor-like helix-turn-helix DNA-binding protein [Actinophytocola sp.]
MDLGPAASPGPELGAPLPASAWVQPVPDHLLGDPAEVAARRESIRLAFVAALQRLPPKQRAVLILRDVLAWHADEVARLLDTTVASVHSASQRARATLTEPAPLEPLADTHRDLLARYVDAFERYDVAALTALLHEAATMSMPPFAWWLRGRADIGAALAYSDGTCRGARLVPTSVNGSPAFGQYHPVAGGRAVRPGRAGGEPGRADVADLASGPGRGVPVLRPAGLSSRGPMSFASLSRISGYE